MDPDRADELRLTFIKDALTAEFAAKAGRRHTLEGAAMAVLGLAFFGYLTGSVQAGQALAAMVLLVPVLLFSHVQGRRHTRAFKAGIRTLLRDLARLKTKERR